MITLHNLLSLSSYINTTLKYRKLHNITLVNQKDDEDGIIFTFNVPSLNDNNKIYTTIIKVLTKDSYLNLTSSCQARCDCSAFKYQHMVMLYRQNGLYGDPPEKNQLPKKHLVLCGCKHLSAAAQELLLNYAKIK